MVQGGGVLPLSTQKPRKMDGRAQAAKLWKDNWIEEKLSPPDPFKNLGLEQEAGMFFEMGVPHSPRS